MKNKSNNSEPVNTQEDTTQKSEKQSAETQKADNSTEEGFNLTDEQWEEVFKHPRFSQLNERAKKAEAEAQKAKKQLSKYEEDKLKEENKYQELYEKAKEMNEGLTAQISNLKLEGQIFNIASRLKVLDTDAVIRLIDKDSIEFDDDGNPQNIEQVVIDLLKSKPYLVEGGAKNLNIGENSNPTTESQGGNFVMTKTELQTKLQDHKWYEEHKDDIYQWQKEGRIDYSK